MIIWEIIVKYRTTCKYLLVFAAVLFVYYFPLIINNGKISEVTSKNGTIQLWRPGININKTTVDINMFSTRRLLTYFPKGRLGNLLFEYSSTFCLARLSNRELVLANDNSLRIAFPNIKATWLDKKDMKNLKFEVIREAGTAAYNRQIVAKTLKKRPSFLGINAYLQSWKYFKACEGDLRSMLAPPTELTPLIEAVIRAEMGSTMSSTGQKIGSVTCVHVRKGDFAKVKHVRIVI